MARPRPRLSRQARRNLDDELALAGSALAGQLKEFRLNWWRAPPSRCVEWAEEFAEMLLHGNVEPPGPDEATEHDKSLAPEIEWRERIIGWLNKAAKTLEGDRRSSGLPPSSLTPQQIYAMDEWFGLMSFAPQVCLRLVTSDLLRRFRSLTEHQRRKSRDYFLEMFWRFRRGRAPGPHPPHAPKTEETPLWIRERVKATHLKYVRKWSWRRVANKLRIADDRQLRRDVKKLGKLVYEALVGKYRHWLDSEGKNLDALLSSHQGARTYLRKRFYLPFHRPSAKAIAAPLAKTLFFIGKRGRLAPALIPCEDVRVAEPPGTTVGF